MTPMWALPQVFFGARLSREAPPDGAPAGRSGTVMVISVNPTSTVKVFGFSTGGMNDRFFMTRPKELNTTG